jgi:hypothetical protein
VENIKVLWTRDGQRHVSVVSYDRPSADRQVSELEADPAVSDVQKPQGRTVQRKYTAGSQK